MQYAIRRTTALRGLLTVKREPIWEARAYDENGSLWFSRWDDEDLWVLDAHFGPKGMPIFSNGTGSRVTAYRVIPSDDPVAREFDALVAAAGGEVTE